MLVADVSRVVLLCAVREARRVGGACGPLVVPSLCAVRVMSCRQHEEWFSPSQAIRISTSSFDHGALVATRNAILAVEQLTKTEALRVLRESVRRLEAGEG